MPVLKLTLYLLLVTLGATPLRADPFDLIIVAGQSNAQGWMGDASFYPDDLADIDSSIPFYWVSPADGFFSGGWSTLGPQRGRFPNGHFGPEITFARQLKTAGYKPAIFKFTQGATSIARNWLGPGDGGLYDQMLASLGLAVSQLSHQSEVCVRAFIWIQGESDAQTETMANNYASALEQLLTHLREKVLLEPDLPVILGVDELHPWVKSHPQVLDAQRHIAAKNKSFIFTSMVGLPKADATHLTPAGLEAHGKRLFKAFQAVVGNSCAK